MKQILITGGAGFIGSEIVNQLNEKSNPPAMLGRIE